MANILFAGFVYNNAGTAIQNAAIDLYDRNTVTPSRANTTSDANGYWAISHATQGRFDVQIVSGTTTRRRKYDDSVQLETLEVAVFRMRNPADTFEYDIVPAAITAARQLNLPLITATDTLMTLGLAQTVTGALTLNGITTLGADVTRAGGQTIDLTGALTRILDVLNSTGSQVADIRIDGRLRFQNNTAFEMTLSGTPTAARVHTLPDVADDTIVLLTATQTLTNKWVQPRVQAVTSAATVTPSGTADDMVVITAQAVALTLANPTGTSVQGQKLIIRIKDNATARAISFGTEYRAMGTALPTTTVVSKIKYLGFIRDTTDTKWDLVAAADEV